MRGPKYYIIPDLYHQHYLIQGRGYIRLSLSYGKAIEPNLGATSLIHSNRESAYTHENTG